jgi:methionyl-tRNA formyltransferase
MRIIFMGTPAFAVPCLSILVDEGYDIVAVVTATDSYGGRGGKQLIESDVKKYSVAKGLRVLQPTNLKSPQFLEQIAALNADVQIVVAFRMLPEAVWNMPPLGTINLHGSLLPKYRGAAPIHHAVMQGETETGVTTFRLKHAIDTGDIILQKKISVGTDENTGSVHDRMMEIGAVAILETVQTLERGSIKYLEQEDSAASHAPKLFHHSCKIDFSQNKMVVHNFIRGLSPFPGAWCKINGKEYKILSAKVSEESIDQSGKIKIVKNRLWIGCANNTSIEILSLKPEGNRLMEVSQFLNGHRFDQDQVDELD